MKAIFLDIDGVLNCSGTPNPRSFPYVIDQGLLAKFRALIERTSATVVLSSSWRVDPVGRLAAEFYGIPFSDICPDLPDAPRCEEMRVWLSHHPEVTRYLVVDDEDDCLDELPLFQPSPKTGLTDELVQGIEDYLNGRRDQDMYWYGLAKIFSQYSSALRASKPSSKNRREMNMTTELDSRIKTALDESRLLILGTQVLFGFAFQGIFQELFSEISPAVQALQCAVLWALSLSVCLLIVPSMYHRIACAGQSRHSALHVATIFTSWGLLPLAVGLGALAFVVLDRMIGANAATFIGSLLTLVALALLFGFGFMLRKKAKPLPAESLTSIQTKIEQLLTEARVIIPGGQALLGFQFVTTLTKSFNDLPNWVQGIHLIGLVAVALSVLLLMTPATLHRLAFHGENDPEFFAISSKLVVAAVGPLAVGIAADIVVVFDTVSASATIAVFSGLTSLMAFVSAWYVFSLLRRGAADGPT